MSGVDAIAERRRALLEELAELDTPDHALVVEGRRVEILESLRLERRGVEAKMREIAYRADDDRVPTPWVEPHEWPSAAVVRAGLAEQVDAIDAEIKRLEAQAA